MWWKTVLNLLLALLQAGKQGGLYSEGNSPAKDAASDEELKKKLEEK